MKPLHAIALRLRRRPHLMVAVVFSLGLHIFFVLLLLWHSPPSLAGTSLSEGGDGTGGTTIYVSMARQAPAAPEPQGQAGAPKPRPPSPSAKLAFEASPTVEQQEARSDQKQLTGDPADSPTSNADVASSQEASSDLLADNAAALGSVEGDQTLLQQIAKCFPVGTMPSLPRTKLTLQVDEQGNLEVSPTTDIDLATSNSDEVRAENAIIQAAMLCGPYHLPPAAKGRTTLLANFSMATNPLN